MLVSDERVKKIGATQEELREAVEQDIRLIGIRVRLIFLLNGAGELLADRAERIQKEQAVIAKIEGMKKEYDNEIKGIPYDLRDFYRVMPGRLLTEILKFIRNPKAHSQPLTAEPTAKKIRRLLRDIRDWREGFAGVKSVDHWKDGDRVSYVRRKSNDEILNEVEKRLLQIAKEAESE